MTAISEMAILMLVLGGGGNELLDFLPTDAYWKAKGVTVSMQTMASELAPPKPVGDLQPLIKDLGSADFNMREAASKKILAMGPQAAEALKPAANSADAEVAQRAKDLIEQLTSGGKAQAVRRLMAIRALGESKNREALPALQALLTSKEQFEAQYAARAVATIEGKPFAIPAPSPAARQTDLWLLPKSCGLVGQIATPPGGIADIGKTLDQMGPMMAMMGGNKEAMIAQMTEAITRLAEQIGNVRLDNVTLGLADDVGNNSGFVVIVARGTFDRAAAKAALARTGMKAETTDGVEVFGMERGEFNLFMPGDDRLVLIGGPRQQVKPVADVLAALKSEKGTPPANDPSLRANADIAKLVAAADTAKPVWAVVKMSEAYRQSQTLAPFDTVIFTADTKPGLADMRLVAQGADAAKVKASVDELSGEMKKMIEQMKPQAVQMPMIQPFVDLLESVKFDTQGGTATVTGTFKGSGAGLFITPLFGMRAMHAENAGGPPPPPAATLPAGTF